MVGLWVCNTHCDFFTKATHLWVYGSGDHLLLIFSQRFIDLHCLFDSLLQLKDRLKQLIDHVAVYPSHLRSVQDVFKPDLVQV